MRKKRTLISLFAFLRPLLLLFVVKAACFDVAIDLLTSLALNARRIYKRGERERVKRFDCPPVMRKRGQNLERLVGVSPGVISL